MSCNYLFTGTILCLATDCLYTGTILCPASDCFVHWQDLATQRVWGLNFTMLFTGTILCLATDCLFTGGNSMSCDRMFCSLARFGYTKSVRTKLHLFIYRNNSIFPCDYLFTGTILCPATECFVHWRDLATHTEWGLNFTRPTDAKRFRDGCSVGYHSQYVAILLSKHVHALCRDSLRL